MILIAGATGYVGRYLCKYMVEQGEDILALGRSGEVLEFFRKSLIPCMEFDITADESYERCRTKTSRRSSTLRQSSRR